MVEDKNKKTTCKKKTTTLVLPQPTAQLVAQITGVSESYVKKVRNDVRPDNTEAAKRVKYCTELIVDGQQILVNAVSQIIQSKKQTPSQ